jgi:hypothetical protein
MAPGRAVRRAALLWGAAALACTTGSRFSAQLPQGLPDMAKWERIRGTFEVQTPPVKLEYELYVAPARPAVYAVTRYRITPKNAKLPGHEKLQWDRNGTDVRRYECVPEAPTRSTPCRWNEFFRGSPEYDGELGPLLSVYGISARQLSR